MTTVLEVEKKRPSAPAAEPMTPPLQAGDRLTQAEFLRRYHAMPKVIGAELIEGVVYMPSPVSTEGHAEPHAQLMTWLGVYRAHTPNVGMGDNATAMLDLDNCPQPDCHLRKLPEVGGRSKLVDGYLHGPPELIVEVAASSASYDLHDKKNAYRRNGVLEYIVWRVWDRQVDWFVLHEGQYLPHAVDAVGVFRSTVFPGLWLDPTALLAGDLAKVLQVLQQGLASLTEAKK